MITISELKAAAVQKRVGRYKMALYKQAGNSIAVPIFESIFRKIILGETEEHING
jgi:DNA (cytosine-5)-methyltransferase 1